MGARRKRDVRSIVVVSLERSCCPRFVRSLPSFDGCHGMRRDCDLSFLDIPTDLAVQISRTDTGSMARNRKSTQCN
eukprot:scaffold345_cov134-Cylindrotheca_fusiformis.AAC.55